MAKTGNSGSFPSDLPIDHAAPRVAPPHTKSIVEQRRDAMQTTNACMASTAEGRKGSRTWIGLYVPTKMQSTHMRCENKEKGVPCIWLYSSSRCTGGMWVKPPSEYSKLSPAGPQHANRCELERKRQDNFGYQPLPATKERCLSFKARSAAVVQSKVQFLPMTWIRTPPSSAVRGGSSNVVLIRSRQRDQFRSTKMHRPMVSVNPVHEFPPDGAGGTRLPGFLKPGLFTTGSSPCMKSKVNSSFFQYQRQMVHGM